MSAWLFDLGNTRLKFARRMEAGDAGPVGSIDHRAGGDFATLPDEVRGDQATLAGAVHAKGWPTLAAARGRIYVLLDVRTAVSNAYRIGHPSLRGRAMFGWYPDGEAESAIQIVQDPLVDGSRISDWVKAGAIVRTRTDANTVEAHTHDMTKAKAAADSGAQAVSTDYYPGAPDPQRLNFVVRLPGGAMARCNPLLVKTSCSVAE